LDLGRGVLHRVLGHTGPLLVCFNEVFARALEISAEDLEEGGEGVEQELELVEIDVFGGDGVAS
jgi:hypothetical protein